MNPGLVILIGALAFVAGLFIGSIMDDGYLNTIIYKVSRNKTLGQRELKRVNKAIADNEKEKIL